MKSIGLKLWVWMMVLVGLLFALLWLFQIVFLESFYSDIKLSEIKKQGYEIANLIVSDEKAEVQNQIDKLSYDNNASVLVYAQDGDLMYYNQTSDSTPQMPMGRNNAIIDALAEAFQGREATLEVAHPRFGNKFKIIAIPIKEKNLAMLINVPMAPVKDTAQILKKQLGIITAVLLFITILFAYFLSKTLTKPIRIITNSAEEIASGNYDTRISIKSKDEIGILCQTINNMAEGLSRVENLRKDLIANVSHELRTPLSIIRSYAETIRDVSGDNKQKRDGHLAVIIEESERLSGMVNDILNLSQLQSGKINLNITRLCITELLREVVSKYDLLSKKSAVSITLEGDGEYFVNADRQRLEQVLYNLINNSLNHTGEGGGIIISAEKQAGFIRVSVKDNGSGIPESELKYIWDRFYKGSSKSGTGLGLSIVKGIFEAHAFNFGADSVDGYGTTIWFDINYL